jgi:hypothetical protein
MTSPANAKHIVRIKKAAAITNSMYVMNVFRLSIVANFASCILLEKFGLDIAIYI